MGQGQFQTDAEYAAAQGKFELDDLKSAKFGSHIPGSGEKGDFRIWHTAGNARLVNRTGDIQFNYATSDTLANSDETFQDQESMLHLEDNAGVKAYYNGDKKFETLSDGAKVTGKFELDGDLKLLNDKKIKVGYDDDLQIYHDTSPSTDASMIKNTTDTELFIVNGGDESIFIRTHSKNSIRCWDSSENYKVGLFHNDTLKFETTSGGVECKEDLKLLNDKKIKVGYDDDLQIYHDTTGSDFSTIKNTTETELFIANSGESIFIRADAGKNGIRLYADNDGADYEVVLYHGGDTEAFRTTSDGAKVTGDLEVTEDLKPNEIKLVNDKKIKIGYDDDLQIYHDTSPSPDASMIKNTTATELFIVNGGDESVFIRANEGKDGVRCWDSSESYKVGLFYDDTLKLETTNTGAKITGTLQADEIKLVNDKKIKIGYDDDLQIYHDTAPSLDASMIKNTTATELFIVNSDESIFIRANAGKDGVRCWDSSESYKVGLFYDDSLKIETMSSGLFVHGHIEISDNEALKLGNSKDFEMYWDGSNAILEADSGHFRFNQDVWPQHNYTSGSKQDLGDGDKRWDDVYCDDVEEASDGRYKENIATSDLGLDFINKLTPRSYTKIYGTSGRTHYGLISQEVEKVITDSGKTTKEFGGIGISEGGMYGLRYNQFLSPLIKAVQELSAEVETLKAEVAALKSS